MYRAIATTSLLVLHMAAHGQNGGGESIIVSQADTRQAAQPRKVTRPTKAQVEALRKDLGSKLRDPYSAVLDNLYVVIRDDADAYTLCGTVNAKNAYGAYVGKQAIAHTVFTNGQTDVWLGEESAGADVIQAICRVDRK